MTRSGTVAMREAVEFALVMREAFPEITAAQILELMRLAKRHGKLSERQCNGTAGPNATDRCERAILEITTRLGPNEVVFGGDPRGYTVKIRLNTKRYNTWGGEDDGWGIPQ